METRRGWQAWIGDDFVDKDTQAEPLVEPDPWEPDELSTQIRHHGEMEQSRREATADDVIDPIDLYDLDDEPPADVRNAREWLDDTVEIPSDWDEPEPVADAASDLSESLYPPDDSVTNLSLELKIGELLVRVEHIDEEQREACVELLKACGIRRLRYMLPWLGDRTWYGTTLRLFLEFRKHWESKANMRWWETLLWSEREQRWMPRFQRGTLTLDHSRELIQRRFHYAASEVIDDEWFWDWDSCAPWELGVRSFANFAVFRAGIPAEDDWREYLMRQDGRCALEIAQCLDPTFAPFMLPSFAQQYELAVAISTETDPWPRASEVAWERAQMPGGDFERAWYDILSGSMNV